METQVVDAGRGFRSAKQLLAVSPLKSVDMECLK